MPLEFISPEDNELSLPWARDWYKSHSKNPISRITSVRIAEKGLLILCEQYKGYIWKGSKMEAPVLKLMNTFQAYSEIQSAVYAQTSSAGTLSVAVDPETVGKFLWEENNEATYWVCSAMDADPSTIIAADDLLPPQLRAMIANTGTPSSREDLDTRVKFEATRRRKKPPETP